MSDILIVIPGPPVPKGRPRAFRMGNNIRMVTPKKTESYEGKVAFFGQQAMRGKVMLQGPLKATIDVYYPPLKSAPKCKRGVEAWKATRPDLDNIVKAITDALNGIVFGDDGQIAVLEATKRHSATELEPSVQVFIEEIVEP